MKKKVYISLPISDGTWKPWNQIASQLRTDRKTWFQGGVTFGSIFRPKTSYAEHIGRDITALLECDAVLVLPGWVESKGCALEMEAARIYGKKILTNYGMLDYYAKEVEDEQTR